MAENEFNSKVVLGDGTVIMDLTSDTITEDALLAGYTAHDKSGAPIDGKCTFDSDTSEDTATADEILEKRTAHARKTLLKGTMPNNGAIAETISSKDEVVTVKQGYHDGSGTVQIAQAEKDKLKPENIRQGVNVLGVEGSMTGSEGVNAQSKTVTPTFTEQTVLPDEGYTHLSQVKVEAISVAYADNSAGGKTVTIGQKGTAEGAIGGQGRG